MIGWLHVALILVSAGFLSLLIFIIIRRWVRPKRRNDDVERAQNLHNGIARLHQVSPHHGHHLHREASKKSNYHLFRRGGVAFTTKPAFSWADHPSLVTEAVENGWSRFAFAAFISSPSVKSARSLLGACAAGDDHESGVEIGWEVCEGSADFMQKIRLNPNVKKGVVSSSTGSAAAAIRAALPLPGPNLGNSSFPQEAYFEVTILSCNENARNNQSQREKRGKSEGDKIKLIDQDFNAKNSPDSLNHAASSHSQRRNKIEEKNEGAVCLSLGLTAANPLPMRIPGTFAPSVGFNSTGSLYLDGTKLIFDSENEDWGRAGKVIGCGYSPGLKKVFFTVDSQVVHEIHCKTEEFCSPLYPTLAANTDVVVLVNFGQSPFRFTPANLQRTPNPCFIGPLATSPALGYEDSRELFSMGRIDSQWLQRSATRSNNNTVNSIKAMEEYDQESEGDLFEIVLDSSGKSPYTTLHNN
ncbi:SPla/RYanodine receptor domain-containing protein [Perilla frutescens var. frutescens]|nr:SPla/RYanodine receptor domain-containing protein [Perilla frutescens var. frutescens]